MKQPANRNFLRRWYRLHVGFHRLLISVVECDTMIGDTSSHFWKNFKPIKHEIIQVWYHQFCIPTASSRYTEDSIWRNRDQFLQGREEIKAFLTKKWATEGDYALKKHYFCHSDSKIAVTFQYEYRSNTDGQWYRAYGNEHWTFDSQGKMKTRNASINDVPISDCERAITYKDRSERFEDGTFLRDGAHMSED